MGGVILLYVGMVLMSNGLYGLQKISDKSNVIMNLFTGGLSLILNIICLCYGICTDQKATFFYGSAAGLLFAFTYLMVAFNKIFDLDQRLYGWYSLFVAVNSIPAGILCFCNFGGNYWYGLIWWLWGILWLTGFIECTLGKSLGKFTGLAWCPRRHLYRVDSGLLHAVRHMAGTGLALIHASSVKLTGFETPWRSAPWRFVTL